jgi:outer membrane receptor protein involved in Fe transport
VAILRAIMGAGLVAGLAAGIVAPAIGAAEKAAHKPRPAAGRNLDTLMSFTPASADPRLAAFLARSGVDSASFRFTPAQPRRIAGNVSVTVRSHDSRMSYQEPRLPRNAGGPALEPIAYSISGSLNWKRLAIGGDVGHVDLAGMPGSRDSTSASIGYAGKRLSGRVKAESDRPTTGAPRVDDLRSYTVDVGGSYALTRNLDVTAGLRYRSDRAERLDVSTDPARESRAVYVGTAFRF